MAGRVCYTDGMEDTRRMADLPEGDRPRERLLRLGAGALSDAELLAILLRTGVTGCNVHELARRLASALGGLAGLRTHDAPSLAAFVRREPSLRGVGPDKLATLLAALEVGARVFRPDAKALRKPILRAAQVAELMFSESTRLAREGFWALFLDRRRVPLRPVPDLITLGLGAQTLIDPQTLFRKAVMLDAHSLILVHNHPSGDVSPSAQDVETTRALVAAGRVLGIPVLDHVIVGRPDVSPTYLSLRAKELCAF